MQHDFSLFHLKTPMIKPHYPKSPEFGSNCGFKKDIHTESDITESGHLKWLILVQHYHSGI